MLFSESRLLLPVRPNDLDARGHVNNAVVLEYLEAGRWDWLHQHGLERGDRVIGVVARAEIDYLVEIPHDRVEIRTLLESPTAAELDTDGLTFRAVFRQRIHRLNMAKVSVDALVTVAFLDSANRFLASLQEFLILSRRHDEHAR